MTHYATLEELADRQGVGRFAGTLAVEVAFAAADIGREHDAADMAQPSRRAIVNTVTWRLGINPRDLTPVERGAMTGLATLAYAIGRGER